MKKIITLTFAWIITWHGTDYGSIISLLDTLPPKVAASAKVFPCLSGADLPQTWGFCVAYNDQDNH